MHSDGFAWSTSLRYRSTVLSIGCWKEAILLSRDGSVLRLGWEDINLRCRYLIHIYHATMARDDIDRVPNEGLLPASWVLVSSGEPEEHGSFI